MKGKAAFVTILLVGEILGGAVGWVIGAEIGRRATLGCDVFECLPSVLWELGGVFVGMVAGAVLGLSCARLLRRIGATDSRQA